MGWQGALGTRAAPAPTSKNDKAIGSRAFMSRKMGLTAIELAKGEAAKEDRWAKRKELENNGQALPAELLSSDIGKDEAPK